MRRCVVVVGGSCCCSRSGCGDRNCVGGGDRDGAAGVGDGHKATAHAVRVQYDAARLRLLLLLTASLPRGSDRSRRGDAATATTVHHHHHDGRCLVGDTCRSRLRATIRAVCVTHLNKCLRVLLLLLLMLLMLQLLLLVLHLLLKLKLLLELVDFGGICKT